MVCVGPGLKAALAAGIRETLQDPGCQVRIIDLEAWKKHLMNGRMCAVVIKSFAGAEWPQEIWLSSLGTADWSGSFSPFMAWMGLCWKVDCQVICAIASGSSLSP